VSEFWDGVAKRHEERIRFEIEQGIRPAPEPEPEPVKPTRVIKNPSRRNQYTGAAMTTEQAQEARRRYEAGESSPQIAKDYGVTPSALRYHVRAAGGTIRPRGNTLAKQSELPDATIQEIATKYRGGTSLAELERQYDATRWQITTGFEKIGQRLRTRSEAALLRYDRERNMAPEVGEQQRKAELVETFRADLDWSPDPWPIAGMVIGSGIPACRCYRCSKLLTAETVNIDHYGPRQTRPICKGCLDDRS